MSKTTIPQPNWNPVRLDGIVADVQLEFMDATKKFAAFHSPHEGFAVLLEEVEELKEAIFWGRGNAREEAIQVAGWRFASCTIAKRSSHDCAGDAQSRG